MTCPMHEKHMAMCRSCLHVAGVQLTQADFVLLREFIHKQQDQIDALARFSFVLIEEAVRRTSAIVDHARPSAAPLRVDPFLDDGVCRAFEELRRVNDAAKAWHASLFLDSGDLGTVTVLMHDPVTGLAHLQAVPVRMTKPR